VRTPVHGVRGPLAGVKILDLTHVVLGPLATQILGDMGADVMKVESPEGDINRQTGPGRNPGMGALYLNINRNKRSIALDLKRPGAADILRRMVAGADVLVHNMRDRAARSLGLDADSLRAVNPRLVHCSASGFGNAGPYADRPAFDEIIQGACGLAAAEGRTDGGRRFSPALVADKTTGLTLAYAVLAGLFARERSGEGQVVEVPMLETMVHFTMVDQMAGLTFDPPVGPGGHARSAQRRIFGTRDGHVAALPYTDRHWRAFFEATGRPELAGDPRCADAATRLRHMDWLLGLVAEALAGMTTAEALGRLGSLDIPCTRVNSLEEALDDPHVTAVGLVGRVDHPSEGTIRAVRSPVVFNGAASPLGRPAPRLGEHGEEILREHGLTDSEIGAAYASGALHRPA
jgi:crotonobetainyl-CoA:carnitine CoA-transferase CaiB-like acyl-CoA transferase